jgi:hypothetical protein
VAGQRIALVDRAELHHRTTPLHDQGHLHYFTYRSLARVCLERAGFSRVVSYGMGGIPGRVWPELFSSEIFILAYK